MGARTACLWLSSILYPPSSRSTDAQQRVPTGCFTSFQLVSPGFSYQKKKIGAGRLKTYVFSYEERFNLRVLCEGFPRVPFHLVSPGCTYDTLKHDKTRYF